MISPVSSKRTAILFPPGRPRKAKAGMNACIDKVDVVSIYTELGWIWGGIGLKRAE